MHVRLLQHVAAEIGGVVIDLAIVGLASTPVIELQKAFFKFENVTKLHLSTAFPLVYAVSSASCIRILVSIELLLREEMIPEYFESGETNEQQSGLHLGALSSLPNLRHLDVRYDNYCSNANLPLDGKIMASFMLGYASIPQLQSLSTHLLDDLGDESREAFAFMLRRLEHLNHLSMLYKPQAVFWKNVHDAGGHEYLQKLDVFFPEFLSSVDDLESMVDACNKDFPSLAELEIRIDWDDDELEAIRVLSGLKSHKSLCAVKCGAHGNFLSKSQEGLGEYIKVTKIPLYEFIGG